MGTVDKHISIRINNKSFYESATIRPNEVRMLTEDELEMIVIGYVDDFNQNERGESIAERIQHSKTVDQEERR